MIIKIKSNYFSINRFVFSGVSRVFCNPRPEFLHLISANSVLHIFHLNSKFYKCDSHEEEIKFVEGFLLLT